MSGDDLKRDVYTHGHHRAVVDQHARRTAETCAAFVLPRIEPTMRILDVGCGPGTITSGLAAAVPRGSVVGIEVEPEVLERARAHCAEVGVTNVEFAEASVYELADEDDSYDVAYAHQVLQHLTDPVAALREMLRVVRPGGIVAVRDADYYTMSRTPESELMDLWRDVYRKVARHNGAEPDAGRYLYRWMRDAGLADVEMTATCWVMADEDSRRNWGESWADRCLQTTFGRQAVEYGFVTQEQLQAISDDWREWAADENGYFHFIHDEALGYKAR